MVAAIYFDGKTTARHSVEVTISGKELCIRGSDWDTRVPLEEVRASEAIHNTPMVLILADGARLEVREPNDALSILVETPGGFWRIAIYLEDRWQRVVVVLVSVILLTYALVQYGMPAVAKFAANTIPAHIDEAISSRSLEFLDDHLLESTQLSVARQSQIHALFDRAVADSADKHSFRLEFRSGGQQIGANALALPSGIVIITDELIELSEHDDEILAVLAHEVGHVVQRHSLRLLLQDAGAAVLVGTLLGDLTGITGLAATLPTLLVQTSYSRRFENEADVFAYAFLNKNQIPSHRLGDLLLRLEREYADQPEVLSYFSTHPPAKNRARD